MSMDIFKETSQHEYYQDLARNEVLLQVLAQVIAQEREKGREEERQAHLKAQRKLLRIIVQSRFPELILVAKTQAWQIKDVTIINEVMSKVCAAQTTEEATNALVSWLPTDDSDDAEEE